ncbi:MAG: hypothetical protein ACOYMA_14705 [Bacteroidia bacterium]
MEKAKRYSKPAAVKELENLALTEKAKKFRHTPIEMLVRPEFTDKTSNGLTKCIITYIQLKGGQAERINSTGRPIDNRTTYTDAVGIARTMGSIEWIKGTSTNGTADISSTIRGRSVKIEVKIKRDVQSAAQKKYQQDVERAGGIYVIAKDFTTFVEWYVKTFEK